MADERRGWFRVHYKLQDNPIWTTLSPAVLKVFVGMMLKAQRFPQKEYVEHEQREFPVGSFRISHRDMAAFCGLSVQQVRDAYEHLKHLNVATFDGTQSGTVVTLLNYKKLQGLTTGATERNNHENKVETTPGTHLEQGQIENILYPEEFYKSFKSDDDALAGTVPSDGLDRGKRTSVSQEFPQTAAAMARYFPVDVGIVRKVVRAAQKVDPQIMDYDLARIINATVRKTQESPGLWLKTVPAYLNARRSRDPSPAAPVLLRGAVGAPARCMECFDTGEMLVKGGLVPCGCRTKTTTETTNREAQQQSLLR